MLWGWLLGHDSHLLWSDLWVPLTHLGRVDAR